MFAKFEYLGTTDERTTCECCGKQGLKHTVAIRDIEQDTDHFFGVTCAARALRVQVAAVRKGAAAADKATAEAKRREQEKARRVAEAAEWAAFYGWAEAKAGECLRDDHGSPDFHKFARHFPGTSHPIIAARRLWSAQL